MAYLFSFVAFAILGLYVLQAATRTLCDAIARIDEVGASRYRPESRLAAVRMASRWMMTRIA